MNECRRRRLVQIKLSKFCHLSEFGCSVEGSFCAKFCENWSIFLGNLVDFFVKIGRNFWELGSTVFRHFLISGKNFKFFNICWQNWWTLKNIVATNIRFNGNFAIFTISGNYVTSLLTNLRFLVTNLPFFQRSNFNK